MKKNYEKLEKILIEMKTAIERRWNIIMENGVENYEGHFVEETIKEYCSVARLLIDMTDHFSNWDEER